MRRLLALVAAAFALASCTYLGGEVRPFRPPGLYPVSPEVPQTGRELYQRDCAFCHGNDGYGTRRAPGLRHGTNGPALTDFMLRTGRMPIEESDVPIRPSDPVYDPEQIAAIVSFVESEFDPPGPDIPDLDLDGVNLSAGQQAYEQFCASCHATTGIGGAMLVRVGGEHRGVQIPDLFGSDAVAVAEAVRTGPGTMPVFPESLIGEEDLNALVAYTLHLQNPPNRGGYGLGRIGPVAEGAAGWALGLGALVLFIRWIGTKAGEKP